MNRFEGKRIIIVGATSGIGLEVAGQLAARGAILGIAGRDTSHIEELVSHYPSVEIHVKTIDVTSPDAPSRLAALVGEVGGMDIYLHAAGIGASTDSGDLAVDAAANLRVVLTNVEGFTRLVDSAYNMFVQAANPKCAGAQAGKPRPLLAAITSIAGTRGISNLAAYSASKAYGSTFLEALSVRARSECPGLAVTDIRPGWVRTPLVRTDRHYPLMIEPEHAATLILRALRRRPSVAYIPARWRFVTAFMRLIPRALWRIAGYRTSPVSGKA